MTTKPSTASPADCQQQAATRRQFFGQTGLSLGSMALAALWAQDHARGAALTGSSVAAQAVPKTHFPPKARRAVFLFMAGGPSQLELFDYKPKLIEHNGQVVPESYTKHKRFAFIKGDARLLGTQRKFARHGQSGAELSELLPHTASIVDDLCLVKSLSTDVFNHGPAKLFMNTGSPQFGRPSLGSWLSYGIGSESQNLPGFVVLQSGPRGPRGGTALWGSGFLPSAHQGVPFLAGPEPILNLNRPAGFDNQGQRRFFDTVRQLNQAHLDATADPEVATRIAAYEMAYRMQSSAPELMDLAGESAETLAEYAAEPGKVSFANNCLLARRLLERGVRFVQLYHTDWDHHGNVDTHLGQPLDDRCRETDRPSAALVRDLKRRGLLDDTLVIWGGEFGRTPMGEPRDLIGRDHHIDAFTMWLAGGGIRGGQTVGATDELGYYPVADPIHVHDLQATILRLLGLDHLRLTYRFQGREFRLTDVGGRVVEQLLA